MRRIPSSWSKRQPFRGVSSESDRRAESPSLALLPAYVLTNSDECFLLWDSEYDAVLRRTLLFGPSGEG